jgi:phosphoribosylaminoimidazole-succinocarboxamide synthase
MKTVRESGLDLPLLRKGKVREMYDLDQHILLVASDRISAFDCILPQPIPRKGAVLTQISQFWFDRTEDIVQNHAVSANPDAIVETVPELADSREQWAGRSMLVRKAEPFPVECVVRGYLAGSMWKEYRESGTLAGEPMPEGMVESDRLESPIFSPATKAEEGHDENITFEQMQRLVGINVADFLRSLSLQLYEYARDYAGERGIIIADTKFEFGSAASGEILLIDEALTPDSSRFWPESEYAPGRSQPSLDKQPVRDYLESLVQEGVWDRSPPAPDLPEQVVSATTDRYLEAFRRITGHDLPDYP